MHPNQELTTHLNEHTNYIKDCDYCTAVKANKDKEFEEMAMSVFVQDIQMNEQRKDNLFNADHRNTMITRYGFSDAMLIKIEDLI